MPEGVRFVSVEITLDAHDAERSAVFWAEALGYTRVRERPPYIILEPPPGAAGWKLIIQKVSEHPSGKARVHLDLRVPDVSAEVARLTALGASLEHVVEEAGTSFTVMTDPEGTHFCLCPARAAAPS